MAASRRKEVWTIVTMVADPRAATAAKAETNFEYDDNEWDIGIGDLIIDLDADIEKTNEKTGGVGSGSMASAAGGPAKGKLAIEHSATVDKGLKMKIKRTKPGTKSSEVKHEIVKSGEQQNGNGNGNVSGGDNKHSAGVKRGSSGHRRDKARDKVEVNGVVRSPVQRVVFPAGPGPPEPPPAPVTPPSPAPAPTLALTPAPVLPEEPKTVPVSPTPQVPVAPPSSPPPPLPKKMKTCSSDISKESVDVCVGTSVGTITEPDCLGPCEPGTSVTLEGIVWHETEGVLVVNVTWRGKTYVGTLLDCTRHDWAPPRFCDSPTSDLDARTPKGRGKRGRQATSTNTTTTSNDLSNFTETRSSVHSKLRSNNNGGAKGRRNPGGPASPTPFVPPKTETTPGKRKPKAPEEEAPAKKSKPPPNPIPPVIPTPVPTPTPTPTPTRTPTPPPALSLSSSPPPSPILLECPEPNCSKKYKHMNGLKYHQSHAHGNVDDEETKESGGSGGSSSGGSLSEAEEEPSPAPVLKKEGEPSPAEVPTPETPTPQPIEVPIPSPQQPPTTPTPTPLELEVPLISRPVTPEKSVIKPGVLRFAAQEEPLLTIPIVTPVSRPVQTSAPLLQSSPPRQPSPVPIIQAPLQLVIQPQQQPISPHVVQIAQSLVQQNPAIVTKVPQFKVKPTSVLMPDDKKTVKPPSHKKKRKSPAGSPHPHPHLLDPQPLGLETSGREDVQSPAYSDISDDGAPVLDPEVDGSKSKPRAGDKKAGEVNSGQSPHSMQHYNMYPYYGQPPYLVPSVTPTENKPKENTSDKGLEAKPGMEKDKKDSGSGEFQQKMLSQHYYPYGYVPGYPYNLDTGYSVPMVTEEKPTVIKEEKSPGPIDNMKQSLPPPPTTLHVPNPTKIKIEPGTKEKHPNENHQILKESIEMKNQMSPAYLYSRSQQQPGQGVQQQDEMRRYYIYPERRKEHSGPPDNPPGLKATPPPHPQPKHSAPVPSPKHKEKPVLEDKKEEKVKQEGVKPTMETQGPPPPPTSSYAYIHPGYMQSPHYGAIPFDPGHSMYARGINPMIVPSPYPNNPYMHPQLHASMPRYHAPEDLSRPPQGGPKALDLLQHHANQYYTSHKIHELQERALKSPTPKATVASSSPSAERGPNTGPTSGPQGAPTSTNPSQPPTSSGKPTQNENKDSRSPPPQRHVHTHHHTHVGLGYPIITGQYPTSYGAAVFASQQAAAVAASAVSPFSPK